MRITSANAAPKTGRPRKGETNSDRAVVDKSIKQAKLVEASRRMARIVKHIDPEPKVKSQRTRLEKSLVKWMKYHGGEAFDQPFSEDHHRVIAKIETAINGGGMFALAMPRGHGKTTILKYAMLYCMLTGRRKYIVVIAATAEMSQDMVEFVRRQMQESDTLHAHYPQVTTYARATDGKAIKAKFQLRADGKTSGINWSKNTLVLPEVEDAKGNPYESNGAILQGEGLTGAIRGKWKDTKSGKTLRPDFVLLDDPQTRESAESESQCNMRERIITGDVLGLAGPRKKIAAVMPCTIVREGDLAARFLDHEKHPEWSGETCSLVKKWPKGQDGLWEEYAKIYRDGIACGDGPGKATTFYSVNRAAMDEGSELSWKHRIREGEISALQTAENLLIESGAQFWAEYQNAPLRDGVTVYSLTPQIVCSKMDASRPAGVVPEWCNMILAASDINPSYGISSAIVGVGKDQRMAVLWYGIHAMSAPQTMTATEIKTETMRQLNAHGEELARLPYRPERWIIDGGGTPEGTVVDFASVSQRTCGIQAVAAFGRGARNYRPTAGKHQVLIREQAHEVIASRLKRWIIWNADYWREMAQRSWTSTIGAPGSCELPAGRHVEFAEQLCREQLTGKGEVGGRMVWIWRTLPGAHDYGDCMAMLYAMAAVQGIGTGGQVAQVSGRKKYSQSDFSRR